MEGPSEPPVTPRKKRRVLLVLLVAAVVVAAGFVVWWEFIRPRTIAEVLAIDHFQPGSAVTLAGTITGIYRENTSYGPRVALQLDHDAECNTTGQVWGDPNATYAVGQTFQTTLHFQNYMINGDPAVSAPELACPFPLGFADVGFIREAISEVSGIMLEYNSTEGGGWLDYRIFTTNAVPYNLSVLPVTLRKSTPIRGNEPQLPAGGPVDSASRWNILASLQNGLDASPIVDQMKSLANGTSANGSLRFVDANADHMLDDGDRLDVRLPPTISGTAWDTYLVQIGLQGVPATYVYGDHLILNGPDGPLDSLPSSDLPLVDLAYAGVQLGPPLRSMIRVASTRIGSPLPLSAVRCVLFGWDGSPEISADLTSLPVTSTKGVTLSFKDLNSDGLLDAGNEFALTGAANQTEWTLILRSPSSGLAIMTFIVGFGSTVGSVPISRFSVQGTNPWTITATPPFWTPELALNRTLRATLLENGQTVIANASPVNGTLGTFANGTLNFTDVNGDGYLSTGDYFTLHGKAFVSYELRITIFFNWEIGLALLYSQA